ncbi:hypothetical protein D3C81_1157820 [compost metagenome]
MNDLDDDLPVWCVGQVLIHPEDARRTQRQHAAFAFIDHLAGNLRFMTQLRLPFRARHVQMMRAEDVGPAVGGLVTARDVRFALDRLPRQIGVVVGHQKRFGNGFRVCAKAMNGLHTGFQPRRLAIRHMQLRLVDVMVNVVAEHQKFAELSRDEIAIDPFLLHQQPNVCPIGHLVLETELVLRILAQELESELMAEQAMASQDGLDNFRRGLVLIDAGRAREAQAGYERLQVYLIPVEVPRLGRLGESCDAARKRAGFRPVPGIDHERGRLPNVIGAALLQRVGQCDRHHIRLT